MTRFLGLGHSHVVALAKAAYHVHAHALTLRGSPIEPCGFHYLSDPDRQPNVVGERGARSLNPKIAALIEEAPDARFVLACLGGNEHNLLSFQPAAPYDLAFPDGHDPAGGTFITEATLRECLREAMGDLVELFGALRAATSLPIVHVEVPPPQPRPRVLTWCAGALDATFRPENVVPDKVRHATWRAQCRVMRDLCEAAGMIYIDVPADLLDRDGMLVEQACSDDATHANESFGMVMLDRVFARLEGEELAA